jgi:hypothetical protein
MEVRLGADGSKITGIRRTGSRMSRSAGHIGCGSINAGLSRYQVERCARTTYNALPSEV